MKKKGIILLICGIIMVILTGKMTGYFMNSKTDKNTTKNGEGEGREQKRNITIFAWLYTQGSSGTARYLKSDDFPRQENPNNYQGYYPGGDKAVKLHDYIIKNGKNYKKEKSTMGR